MKTYVGQVTLQNCEIELPACLHFLKLMVSRKSPPSVELIYPLSYSQQPTIAPYPTSTPSNINSVRPILMLSLHLSTWFSSFRFPDPKGCFHFLTSSMHATYATPLSCQLLITQLIYSVNQFFNSVCGYAIRAVVRLQNTVLQLNRRRLQGQL